MGLLAHSWQFGGSWNSVLIADGVLEHALSPTYEILKWKSGKDKYPDQDAMAIQLIEKNGGRVLEVTVSGKLAHEDYQRFVPEFERLLKEHGKLRVLFEMADFHGWEAGALWDDIKFDLRHFSDVERLAMVGERQWEKGMSVFCKPFTTAHIRYFDKSQAAQARAWLEGA